MATVTYDQQRDLARFAKRRRVTYPVLADPNSEVIRAFGLLNEDYPAGSYAHGVAHPIIVVFNTEGVVTHRFSRSGYVSRPDIDLVLRTLSGSSVGEGPVNSPTETAETTTVPSGAGGAWARLKRVFSN